GARPGQQLRGHSRARLRWSGGGALTRKDSPTRRRRRQPAPTVGLVPSRHQGRRVTRGVPQRAPPLTQNSGAARSIGRAVSVSLALGSKKELVENLACRSVELRRRRS